MDKITILQKSQKPSTKESRLLHKEITTAAVDSKLARILEERGGQEISDIGMAKADLQEQGPRLLEEVDRRISLLKEKNRQLKIEAQARGLKVASIDKRNNLGDPFETDDSGTAIDVVFRIIVSNADELIKAVSFIREKGYGVMTIGAKTNALQLGDKTHEAWRSRLEANIGVEWVTFSDPAMEKKSSTDFKPDNISAQDIKEKYGLIVPKDYQKEFDFIPHPEIETLPIALLKAKDFPKTTHRVICRAGVPVQQVNDFANKVLDHPEYEFALSSDLTSKHEAHTGATLSTNGRGGGRIGLSADAEIIHGADANAKEVAVRYSKRHLQRLKSKVSALSAEDDSEQAQSLRGKLKEVKTSIKKFGSIEEIAGTNGASFAVAEQQFELNALPKHTRGFYITGIPNMAALMRVKNQLRIFSDMHPDGSVRVKSEPLLTGEEILDKSALTAAIKLSASTHQFDKQLLKILDQQEDGTYNLFVTYRAKTDISEDPMAMFEEGPFQTLGLSGLGDEIFELMNDDGMISSKQESLLTKLRQLDLSDEKGNPLFGGIRVLTKKELPRADQLRHSAPESTRREARNSGAYTHSEDKDHYCRYIRIPQGLDTSSKEFQERYAEVVKRYPNQNELKAELARNQAYLEKVPGYEQELTELKEFSAAFDATTEEEDRAKLMDAYAEFAASMAEKLIGRNEDNYREMLVKRWPDVKRYDYGHAGESTGMPGADIEGGVNDHERVTFPLNSPHHRHDGPETTAGLKKAKKYHQMDLFALDGIFGIEVRIPEKSLITNSEYWIWRCLKYPKKAARDLEVMIANGVAEDGSATLAYRIPVPTPGKIIPLKDGLVGLMNKEVLEKYQNAKSTNEKYQILAKYLGPIIDIADETHRGARVEALVAETTRLTHEKLNLSSEQYPFFVGEALEVPHIVTRNLGEDAISSGKYKVETITINNPDELKDLNLSEDQNTFYAVEIQGLGIPSGLCLMIAPRKAISESWDRTQQGLNKSGFRNLTDMVKKWPYGTEETPNTPLIALLGLSLDKDRLPQQQGRTVPYEKINLIPGPTEIADELKQRVDDTINSIDTLNERDFTETLEAIMRHMEFGDGLIAASESATQIMQLHAMSMKESVKRGEICPIYISCGEFGARNHDIAVAELGKKNVHQVLLPETTSPSTLMDLTVDRLLKIITANPGKMPIIHHPTSETSVTSHVYPHEIVDALKAKGYELDKDYCLVCDMTSGAAAVDYARPNPKTGQREIPASKVFFSCQKAWGAPPGEAYEMTKRNSPLRDFTKTSDADLAQKAGEAREFSSRQRYADALEGKVVVPLGTLFIEQILNGENLKTPTEVQAHARRNIALWGAALMSAPHNTHLVQDKRSRAPHIHGEQTTLTNSQMEIRTANQLGLLMASLYGGYAADGNRKFAARVSREKALMAAVILQRLRELSDINQTRNPLHPTLACREPIALHKTLRWLAEGEITLDDILMSTSTANYIGHLIHTRNAIAIQNGNGGAKRPVVLLPSYGITEANLARFEQRKNIGTTSPNVKLNSIEKILFDEEVDDADDFTLNLRRLERIKRKISEEGLYEPLSLDTEKQRIAVEKLTELINYCNEKLELSTLTFDASKNKSEYVQELDKTIAQLKLLDELPYYLQADFIVQAARYKGENLEILDEILSLNGPNGEPITDFAEEMHQAEIRIRHFIAQHPKATYKRDDETSREAIRLILEFQERASALADILDQYVAVHIEDEDSTDNLHPEERDLRIPWATRG